MGYNPRVLYPADSNFSKSIPRLTPNEDKIQANVLGTCLKDQRLFL